MSSFLLHHGVCLWRDVKSLSLVGKKLQVCSTTTGTCRLQLALRSSWIDFVNQLTFQPLAHSKSSICRRISTLCPSQPCRTRFAPSPTGLLHVGGLRTALFNYLLAKQTKGQFILRIEDTDQTRIAPGSQKNLIEMLQWAGLEFDEGPPGISQQPDSISPIDHVSSSSLSLGPYIQSERLSIYKTYVDHLVEKGHAYRCFCSPERLDLLRRRQSRQGILATYDRFCLKLTPDQIAHKLAQNATHVIRLKIPPGQTLVEDVVMGTITFKNRHVDDQILLKSDGYPTYHLANVVDDHLMQITHVIRGEEWLPSTPKHVILYQGFGWKLPQFVHLPLLLNPDRSKLSKRQSNTSVTWYRDQGYLPEAVLNFAALMGWNPGDADQQEVFAIDEMLNKFHLQEINKSSAIVNIQKLDWINSQHIRKMAADESASKLVQQIRPFLQDKLNSTIDTDLVSGKAKDESKLDQSIVTHLKDIGGIDIDESYLLQILSNLKDERFNTLPSLVDRLLCFFVLPNFQSDSSIDFLEKFFKPSTLPLVKLMIMTFKRISKLDSASASEFSSANHPWDQKMITSLLNQLLKEAKQDIDSGIKKLDIYQTLRYTLTGKLDGPEILVLVHCLGIERCIVRLQMAKNALAKSKTLQIKLTSTLME